MAGVIVCNLAAQVNHYDSSMKSDLLLLKNATSSASFMAVAQKFETLALEAKSAWEPYYYAALARIEAGRLGRDEDKDAVADKVDALLMGGETIQKNSELYTLHYFNEILRLLVDPGQRWAKSSGVLDHYFQQAIDLNPNNPRIYFLKAKLVLQLPADKNGGKENALPLVQRSVELFERYEPDRLFEPSWGGAEARKVLEECKH